MLSASDLIERVNKEWWTPFDQERKRLDWIDKWWRWEHDDPHRPKTSTPEYRELVARAQTPYLGLVVTACAQSLYVEGYRRSSDPDDAVPWGYWQANGMDARQIPIHRGALAYGLCYETVLPGVDDQGKAIPVMRGVSPRKMMAFYEDPAEDLWPEYAMRADCVSAADKGLWKVRVYDDTYVYTLSCESGGGNLEYVTEEAHDVGVCPVVRFANMLDLEGRAEGEVVPLIPLQGRIDQGIFDRLVIQRFAAWTVRYITGMEKPDNKSEEQASAQALKISDLLITEDPQSKVGSLPPSPLDGHIAAHDSDLKDLAAVSQTAPHYLLGSLVNLSAEALAAAETGATRKKIERQHTFGESHEQALRLGASIMGDTEAAGDHEAQVRWRNTSSRSLAQAADALGKMVQMLGWPAEMAWEQLPEVTQADIERAKDLDTHLQGVNLLVQQLEQGTQPPVPGPVPSADPVKFPVGA